MKCSGEQKTFAAQNLAFITFRVEKIWNQKDQRETENTVSGDVFEQVSKWIFTKEQLKPVSNEFSDGMVLCNISCRLFIDNCC